MRYRIISLIFTLVGLAGFSQTIDSITEKVADNICDCIKDDISSYDEIKPEFNRCYDKEFNQIFNVVDAAEQKLLLEDGALDKVSKAIIPVLNSSCEKIRSIIESDIEDTVEPAVASDKEPCPTNFSGKDIKQIEKWYGEIAAFNGLVTKVYITDKDKPYYEVKLEGGNTIWIASLVNSGYEIEGNVIRILGYVSEVVNDEVAKEFNDTNYHVLAFCVIDIKGGQMATVPGTEVQVKQWINGTVP